jgi:hypothetical protein
MKGTAMQDRMLVAPKDVVRSILELAERRGNDFILTEAMMVKAIEVFGGTRGDTIFALSLSIVVYTRDEVIYNGDRAISLTTEAMQRLGF